jgi:hypothetical protein
MSQPLNMQAASIVCHEVAINHAPILYAERSEPIEEGESGWQFLCGRSDEDWKIAQVWALREVLASEPSLRPFIDLPVGTVLSRVAPNAKWVVAKTP